MYSRNANEDNSLYLSVYPVRETQMALVKWDRINDPTIRRAFQRNRPLCFRISFDLGTTPFGTIAWFLITVYLREQLEESASLYSTCLFFHPQQLEREYAEWHLLLRTQSMLPIMIQRGNISVNLSLIEGVSLTEFVNVLDELRGLSRPSDQPQQAIPYLYQQLYPTVRDIERLIRAEHDPSQGHKRLLLRSLARLALVNLGPHDSLYQVIQNNRAEAIENYLEAWTARIPDDSLNGFLASPGLDTEDELLRDWLFSEKCIELNQERSHSRLKIAMGLSPSRSWWLSDVPNGQIYADELMIFAKTYRCLLRRVWRDLLGRDDMLNRESTLLLLNNLGNIPYRSQFDRIKAILQGAVLERHFSIEQKTIIEIGKEGCEEIEFLPIAQGGLQCLFKITTLKEPGENLCLLGELNALAGSVAFTGPPPEESVQDHLRLLLFLVVVGYRDLIVARERLGKGMLPKGTRESSRSHKKHSSDLGPTIRYIPRFRGKIDENFAEPTRLVKTLDTVAPHICIAHIRSLPEGHKRSTEAEEAAQEYGFAALPEGYTFVKPYEVGDPLELADLAEVRTRFRSISLLEILFNASASSI